MSITAAQVEHLVGTIVYKPDWTFRVMSSYGTRVDIEVVYHTRETDPWNAKQGYTEHRDSPFTRDFTVDCDRCETEVEVCRVLFENALAFDAELLGHEAREFFRVHHMATW